MNLSSVERFGARATYYSSHRPGYPEALTDLLVRTAELAPGATVADIGSGTGISSRHFVERGFQVFAVEPNGAMRAQAEEAFGAQPNFRSLAGTAEATTLPDHSMRLVTAATAFHWFDEGAARAEFCRIVEPGGWAALYWNRRLDGTIIHDVDPFSYDYDHLLQDCTEYAQSSHRRIRTCDDLAPFFGARPAETHFPNAQHLDLEGLKGRLLSSSYAPLPGTPGYQPLLDELEALFERHQQNGLVTMRYDTCVFYGPMVAA
jgi:SAM-dependent methyltransferase